MLSRRRFLEDASIAALVLSWHSLGQTACAEPSVAPREDQPRFSALRLQTARLDEMRRFYLKTLGLPLDHDGKSGFGIHFGKSVIEFTAAEQGEPFYHFAFNIPENKFAAAKAWLAKRCPLLKDNTNGSDETFFQHWNAHAVYFQDPGGNIGELIARHTLPNAAEGDFEERDILYVSEIGLVSKDPESLGNSIEENFGFQSYLGQSMFMGDERGLFVLPPVDRLWIPERRQKAAVHPAEVVIAGDSGKVWQPPELPYVLRRGE
jgi:hypothetical protein